MTGLGMASLRYSIGVIQVCRLNCVAAWEALDQPTARAHTATVSVVAPSSLRMCTTRIEPSDANAQRLQRVRVVLRDVHRVATTVGFGPRYLHSTGQLHKGGPDRGVFIQILDDSADVDFAIPRRNDTFRQLIDAQTLGDFMSLRRHGRRVARLPLSHLEEFVVQ
jgi:hypothetical protein